MFTFCPDFEAATLKIPNKEYTAYGNVAGNGSGGSTGMRNGAGGYSAYAGSNDPYNLVTVNQGGVVVDTGREGTVTSWPAAAAGEDINGGHFLSTGGTGTGLNLPPRKQIIGFAKFKTRDAALMARDGLQGRRVDIDKGAVLKAEMAKKNLHTKRGVGPVSVGTTNGTGTGSNTVAMHQNLMSPTGLGTPAPLYGLPGSDTIGMREREMGTLGAMGLGGRLNQWRDQMQQQDHSTTNGIGLSERADDDRRATLINTMGITSLGSITRGPRERAEDDERERRRKEKEAGRLRPSNSIAYEAFHSVPAGISRNISTHGTSTNDFTSSAEHESGNASLMVGNGTDISGPWDNVRTRVTRPPSPSQRSVSPSNGNTPPSDIPSGSFAPLEQSHFQFFAQVRNDQHMPGQFSAAYIPHTASDSSSSSVASASQANMPAAAINTDISRALGDLDMNTEGGKTSPELPSPASGASSRNGVDQNPPVCPNSSRS